MKHKTKVWNGQPAKYVQLKMDGNYTRIVTDEFGHVKVYSSIGTDLTAKCKPFEFLRPHYARLPHGTIVLGELYVHEKPCSAVKTALNEQWDTLRFSAFAVETMPAKEPLESVAKFCTNYGIDFLRWRRIVDGDTVEQLMADLPFGAEGYVLKDGNMLNWYKLKPVLTVDLIVEDYTDGDGKYYGQIGSIICRTVEGCEVATVSGMDDETRANISKDPRKHIGRVVEVHYQGVGTRGRLRHPRFIRWRDDKVPEECGLDQDPNLDRFWA